MHCIGLCMSAIQQCIESACTVFVLYRKKSSRTITFNEFKEALTELSGKRFKGKSSEEAAEEVFKLIEGKSPVISGVTVKTLDQFPVHFSQAIYV